MAKSRKFDNLFSEKVGIWCFHVNELLFILKMMMDDVIYNSEIWTSPKQTKISFKSDWKYLKFALSKS